MAPSGPVWENREESGLLRLRVAALWYQGPSSLKVDEETLNRPGSPQLPYGNERGNFTSLTNVETALSN